MESAFKNLLHIRRPVASGKICPTDLDSCQERVESMAEGMVMRATKLQRDLDMLPFSGLSQKEKAKIKKWADKENEELIHLKKIIREQKASYIKTITTNDLIRLANHHPVWKTHFNVYMDQIQKAALTYEGENAFVRCALKPLALDSLKLFRDAGDGDVLCINSDRGLRYEDGWLGQGDGVRRVMIKNSVYPRRTNMFRMVEGIRAQWLFTGDTWGLNNYILWLDFGTKEEWG
jgi:hypothetical protein